MASSTHMTPLCWWPPLSVSQWREAGYSKRTSAMQCAFLMALSVGLCLPASALTLLGHAPASSLRSFQPPRVSLMCPRGSSRVQMTSGMGDSAESEEWDGDAMPVVRRPETAGKAKVMPLFLLSLCL